MDTIDIQRELESRIREAGFSLAIGSIERLNDLKDDLEKNLRDGLISQAFFKERLSHFKFVPHNNDSKIKSIFVTAAPQTQQETVFWFHDKAHHIFVPPTYSDESDNKVQKILKDTLKPHGFRITRAIIPEKITAVRLGLARYGRNNITYIDEMGSYYRLRTFFSDFPVDEDHWHELELMPQCKNCTACQQSCPTNAILEERILLQSDRCLTYFNERMDDFPPWIDKSWHNSLIGCMQCQNVCPMNRNINIHPDNAVEFTEEETRAFLNAKNESELPISITNKLEELDFIEDWPLLVRNLKAILMK
jgi:epoxyqueuosine reductase